MPATKKKSSSSRRSKSTSAKSNGELHPVGTELTLSDEDRATLSKASDPLQAAINRHSSLRRQFLRQEQMLLAQMAQAEKDYQTALILIGKKYDIEMGPDSGQSWNYGGDTGVLKRLG